MTIARETFLDLLLREEFEHSGGLVLRSYEREGDSLRLSVRLEFGGDPPSQIWNVRVERPLHECINSDWADRAYIGSDHPAFAPFREHHCDIYFTENALPARELLGIASIACAMELGKWHPPTEYLNELLGLTSGRCGPFGLLGRFPRSVAARILEQVANLPIQLVLLNERPPVYWGGGDWVGYPETVEAFVFGSSYVIGEGLLFEPAAA